MDFLITHKGEGKFEATFENGETKEVGPNTIGMIRYTYFEDYTVPDIGWQITQKQLWEDYVPKLQKDALSGKIKPNQMNY